jgi:general secretion pathway protein F
MASADLARYLAISDQLVALVKAGIPVHLGLPSRLPGAVAACERIGAAVARRASAGASIPEALQDRDVPASYRAVVQCALAGGDLAQALTGASRMAEAEDEARHAVRASLRYPLVICGLAYLGIILFSLFLVPVLDSMYQSMAIQTGWGLAVANALRTALPFWVAIPPLLLLWVVVMLRWSAGRSTASGNSGRMLALLPGMSQIASLQRWARFAETLAGYLDADVSWPQALRSSSSAWESEIDRQGTLALAESIERGETPREDSPFAAGLPPLLRWAIWHGDHAVGRSRALHMAAGLYRHAAERRIQRLRVVAPIVTCLVIGGGVTLLYALVVFVPVTQMIQGLAG